MAATWYLSIIESQPPFDTGALDAQSRTMWTFNVIATKRPSATFQQELIAILVDAGVGTCYHPTTAPNGNIVNSSKAVIPTGNGPYLSIVASGGIQGLRVQNQRRPAYEKPSAQITVRASSAAAAEQMSRAAYAALLDVRNQDVTTS